MASNMREQWLAAMRSEINTLVMNDIFNLAISTHWVLKLKALEIFKACFVARGFLQKAGIDFDDMYAPILQLENLHLLLAYAVMNSHIVHSMDMNNAFLQVDLHEEIYMTQPEGFVNPDRPHHIYRLKKALYGLKQAPLAWNHTLNTFLVQISFAAASTDPCLYATGPYDPELHCTFIHSSSGGRPLIILSIYVNNLLILGSPININAIKKQLCQQFHIKDFGSVSTILRINIIYNMSVGTLDISQQQKILDLATKFELLRAKPLSCPLPVGTNLCVVERTSPTHASLKFRRLVSALLYITLATQPDTLHAIIYLSQFICAFNNTHFEAVWHVLHYLHGTIKQTIHYMRDGSNNETPIIHCDASYSTNPLTMKSYSGNITKTITLLTAEAELVAVTDAMRLALYLQCILPTLGLQIEWPIWILNDNQSTITIMHKPIFAWPKRLKHITIKHAFVHDHIQRKDISVDYIPMNDNLADFLTKHITRPKLKCDKIKLDLSVRN